MSPIYLYSCGECQGEAEVLQPFNSEPPVCCGVSMSKLPTAPAKIEIKGIHSGGYKKDYAKDYRRRLQERKEQKPTRKLAPARRG